MGDVTVRPAAPVPWYMTEGNPPCLLQGCETWHRPDEFTMVGAFLCQVTITATEHFRVVVYGGQHADYQPVAHLDRLIDVTVTAEGMPADQAPALADAVLAAHRFATAERRRLAL